MNMAENVEIQVVNHAVQLPERRSAINKPDPETHAELSIAKTHPSSGNGAGWRATGGAIGQPALKQR